MKRAFKMTGAIKGMWEVPVRDGQHRYWAAFKADSGQDAIRAAKKLGYTVLEVATRDTPLQPKRA